MSSSDREFELRFEGVSVADAGTMAKRLKGELKRIGSASEVEIRKDDATNQDFGATLVLVLGTPAIVAIANGIASYLTRDRAKVTISKDGKVVAENVSGGDAARIVEVMSKAQT